MKNSNLTEEQAAVVDAVRSGAERVVVQAYAGSGKTFTLVRAADAAVSGGKRVLYLVFNRAMRMEAEEKFRRAGLSSVDVLTAHKLAWDRTPSAVRERVVNYPYQLYPALWRLVPLTERCPGLAGALVAGLVRFSHSADRDPSAGHIPLGQRAVLARCGVDLEEAGSILKRLWRCFLNPRSGLPLLHDFYLKALHLRGVRLPYDLILYDEAQDANAPMRELVLSQPAQTVFVGDAYQSLYAWRGAVNALAEVRGLRLYLSRTFRFGPEAAGWANRVLALLGERVPLRPALGLATRVRLGSRPAGGRVAVLVRSNAEALLALRELYALGYRRVRFLRDWRFLRLVEDVVALSQGRSDIASPALRVLTWGELLRGVGRDPGAYGELATLVRLVAREPRPAFLVRELRRAMRVKLSEADAVVATVHQAKGLEWDRVWVRGRFRLVDEHGSPVSSELMLLYVAFTRARQELFLPLELEAGLRALEGAPVSSRAA